MLTTPPCVRTLSLQTGRILWDWLRNTGIEAWNVTNKEGINAVEISTGNCCCYQHYISLHCTYLAAIHSRVIIGLEENLTLSLYTHAMESKRSGKAKHLCYVWYRTCYNDNMHQMVLLSWCTLWTSFVKVGHCNKDTDVYCCYPLILLVTTLAHIHSDREANLSFVCVHTYNTLQTRVQRTRLWRKYKMYKMSMR